LLALPRRILTTTTVVVAYARLGTDSPEVSFYDPDPDEVYASEAESEPRGAPQQNYHQQQQQQVRGQCSSWQFDWRRAAA
jgi:hypothetical protein